MINFKTHNKRIKINRIKINHIIKRTMIGSRCVHAARAAYHCLQTITKITMLNDISKNNHEAFNKEIGALALDSSLGTPQHKKAIIGHMLNYPFDCATMYGLSNHVEKIVTNEPVGPSSHVITELPVCEALLDRYSTDIIKVQITSDTQPVIMEGQKQTNYDFIFTIKTKLISTLDNMFGFKPTIEKMQDCKDGGGILKHVTRGSIGIITFDKDGKNIQTTPYPILENDIIQFNEKRLNHLTDYLKNNGLYDHFSYDIRNCFKELRSEKSIFDINLSIENILWNNIQRNPLFPRSISFVFLQKTHFEHEPTNFERRLIDTLNSKRDHSKPYSLDKKGDAKEFYIACLETYYKEVDPQIFDKLLYLKKSGITFNTFFNDILTSCMNNL